MSRIGNKVIEIPAGVTVTVSDKNEVTVKGPKGSLTQQIDRDITVEQEDGILKVLRPTDQKRHKALHGLYRSLVYNMIVGVNTGYRRELELVGVGYRANANNNVLELSLGYSHAIFLAIPEEIKATTLTEKGQNPKIFLEGIDKELIGLVSAKIRSLRKVEPYKGKGVRFVGEQVRRKAGKAAAKK